jgi:hypothetical protein
MQFYKIKVAMSLTQEYNEFQSNMSEDMNSLITKQLQNIGGPNPWNNLVLSPIVDMPEKPRPWDDDVRQIPDHEITRDERDSLIREVVEFAGWIEFGELPVHFDEYEKIHLRDTLKFDNGIELILRFFTPTKRQTLLVSKTLPFSKEELLDRGFITSEKGYTFKICSSIEEVKKEILELLNATF